jgi:hypothetical protein
MAWPLLTSQHPLSHAASALSHRLCVWSSVQTGFPPPPIELDQSSPLREDPLTTTPTGWFKGLWVFRQMKGLPWESNLPVFNS